MRPQYESLQQSGQSSSLYPAEEKYSAVFIKCPILSSLPKMAKEPIFCKSVTQWVWIALITQPVPYCSHLFVVFANRAPCGGVAGYHTFSAYNPAACCWLVTGGNVR